MNALIQYLIIQCEEIIHFRELEHENQIPEWKWMYYKESGDYRAEGVSTEVGI